MKGFITAALLTMPLSLFAEGGTTAGGTEATGGSAPAAAATAATMPAAAATPTAMSKVTCVGKMGAALTDDQKKSLESAGVKAKSFKSMKAQEVDSVEKCKGSYTIENGTASKVMHKKAMPAAKK